MTYVYILASQKFDVFYTGCTDDLKQRIEEHNSGKAVHSSKYIPWKLKTYIAFSDKIKAYRFEKYLKSGSGRAFAKKYL